MNSQMSGPERHPAGVVRLGQPHAIPRRLDARLAVEPHQAAGPFLCLGSRHHNQRRTKQRHDGAEPFTGHGRTPIGQTALSLRMICPSPSPSPHASSSHRLAVGAYRSVQRVQNADSRHARQTAAAPETAVSRLKGAGSSGDCLAVARVGAGTAADQSAVSRKPRL